MAGFRITTRLGFGHERTVVTDVINTMDGTSCGRYSADGRVITNIKSSDNIKNTSRVLGEGIDITKDISLEGLKEEWANMSQNPPPGTTPGTFTLPGMSGPPSASGAAANAFNIFTSKQPYQCNTRSLKLKLPIPEEDIWMEYRRISQRPD